MIRPTWRRVIGARSAIAPPIRSEEPATRPQRNASPISPGAWAAAFSCRDPGVEIGCGGPPLRICGRMRQDTAAAWAATQVERVRDDPEARMALLSRTYDRLCAPAPRF